MQERKLQSPASSGLGASGLLRPAEGAEQPGEAVLWDMHAGPAPESVLLRAQGGETGIKCHLYSIACFLGLVCSFGILSG